MIAKEAIVAINNFKNKNNDIQNLDQNLNTDKLLNKNDKKYETDANISKIRIIKNLVAEIAAKKMEMKKTTTIH